MLDVGWGDLIDYLGDDPHTTSIVIYMESIGDARAFLSAAREVALTKPIIVIKAGRTEAAAKAAASHTGALTGSDEVLDAAFRRVRRAARRPHRRAVLHGRGAGQAAAAARAAADDRHQRRRPRRARDRRADRAAAASWPRCRAETLAALERASCPPHWSHGNPIDILGDAGPERYAKALEIAAGDPNSDGLLVDPDAAGDDRPDADRRARSTPYAQIDGQAGPGELDGRRRRRRGRATS